MLPSFSKDIPELLKRTVSSNPSASALITKSDSDVLDWKEEILEIIFLKVAERCPSSFLNELGYMFSAGLLDFDTERTKRIKVYTAIQRHKKRGSWTNDAKALIDAIAGGNSSLVKNYFDAEWILWAKESSDLLDYTSTLGEDGVDSDLGIDLCALYGEAEIAGIVWIDVDNDSLTAQEVENIVVSLNDVCPAYFRVVLGYFDSISGFWTVYATIG